MTKLDAYYENLLLGFNRNELSMEQVKELLEFIEENPGRYETIISSEHLKEQLNALFNSDGFNIPASVKERMQERLLREIKPKTKVVRFRWAAAAAVLLILGSVGLYFLLSNKPTKEMVKNEMKQPLKNDIAAPQSNKATLTLADGSKITLDSAANGSLAMQGNVNIQKTADGKLVYNGSATEVKYNTLSVPKGSKPVELTLADGSLVWLNVASSITYPTAFLGKERKVQITGEAYFEVFHNEASPFTVASNDVDVKVLGTHFNVNAYDDEDNLKVTLLEGSVKVSKGSNNGILKPGQQAQVAKEVKIVNCADLEQVMAWKNGRFKFSRTDLKVIMREIGRWYDVDVEYQGNIPVQLYNVGVPRTANASEVLNGLEYTGAHFTIEGKKIIVRP